jgi:phage tail sheath protein FI
VANIDTGLDLFANKDEVDISLIVTGFAADANTTLQNAAIDLATSRKDCMAFVSPPKGSVVGAANTAALSAWSDNLNKSSFAFADSGWKYQFDKYNNIYRWIPLNGDIAGLCVRTDETRDPWFSPAGYSRGAIKNVVKLAWNPNQTQRDTIYAKAINPVISAPGQGTLLFGDKTLITQPSAFDRINVRRLFIVLEKAIATSAKYSLFELNDEFTRAQFIALVEPFLRDVKGRRGIYDYRVVCDTTNNTAQVIDSNKFIGDIYIKPARSINFIQLNFVAVRSGVNFTEIVGAV